MEQQHLLDEMETNPVRKRPVFLLVICILTWVGCAFSLISSGYQFFLYSTLANEMKNISSQVGSSFSNTYDLLMWSALIGAVGALICVAGSLVMFTLRKWGFYVYLVGEVAPLIIGGYISLSMVGGLNVWTVGFMIASWIIPIGFIVMYALNMKHMRK